jgi:multidrug efflux pump subunit AcrB
VVFLPLRLLKGVVGQFFAALSITLTIAVLVSLVLALTIIPLMSDQFLTARDAEADDAAAASTSARPNAFGTLLLRIRKWLDSLSARYQQGLERVLHHRQWALITCGILSLLGRNRGTFCRHRIPAGDG